MRQLTWPHNRQLRSSGMSAGDLTDRVHWRLVTVTGYVGTRFGDETRPADEIPAAPRPRAAAHRHPPPRCFERRTWRQVSAAAPPISPSPLTTSPCAPNATKDDGRLEDH